MYCITVLEFWTLSAIVFIYNVTEPQRSGVRISMIFKFEIIVIKFGYRSEFNINLKFKKPNYVILFW